jgi:integrase
LFFTPKNGILSAKIHVTKGTFMSAAIENHPDSLKYWMQKYQELAVYGIRSDAVDKKIALHLTRFLTFFKDIYGHDRISTFLRRDALAWQSSLGEQYAPATVNNHIASLSRFTTWVQTHNPRLFLAGDPVKEIGELPLPPLEPRSLTDKQVASLKNLCDRLESLYHLKGRRWATSNKMAPQHIHARPLRDRAIIFVMLSTGLRREELVKVNMDQLIPNSASELREARKAQINCVQGKGKTRRTVFLSSDARHALAEYLEQERLQDTEREMTAIFLSATGTPARSSDGRLSPRSINRILERIGRLHDAEYKDPSRHISPLRPHDLRHTFAFRLAESTGADAYELERRLGHRSQRYIQRYTNPPEQVAATYVETF